MPTAIQIDNASGSDDVPDESTMRGWILAALAHENKTGAELAVRIVDEAEITGLNRRFRHKNRSTNVLSFPAELPEEIDIPLLGDIAVCAPVVAAEARQQGKTAPAHWAHMLVHGTLHLLGYDHIGDADSEKMEAVETTIMTQLGFPPPYEERPDMLEGEQIQ